MAKLEWDFDLGHPTLNEFARFLGWHPDLWAGNIPEEQWKDKAKEDTAKLQDILDRLSKKLGMKVTIDPLETNCEKPIIFDPDTGEIYSVTPLIPPGASSLDDRLFDLEEISIPPNAVFEVVRRGKHIEIVVINTLELLESVKTALDLLELNLTSSIIARGLKAVDKDDEELIEALKKVLPFVEQKRRERKKRRS